MNGIDTENKTDNELADELTELFRERAAAVPPHVPPAITTPELPQTRRRLSLVAAAVLFLAGLGGAAAAARFRSASSAPAVEIEAAGEPGQTSQDQTGEGQGRMSQADLDGVLNEMARNHPVLVVTGADWCRHCEADLPGLVAAIQAEVPDMTVVGVAGTGDTIWDTIEWPFLTIAVTESGGEDNPTMDVTPTGIDLYPGVGFWTSDGVVGPVVSAEEATVGGWLAEGAEQAWAARLEYAVFRDVVALYLPVPNDQRPALRAFNGLNNAMAELCGSDERTDLDDTSLRLDQSVYADLDLIAGRGMGEALLTVHESPSIDDPETGCDSAIDRPAGEATALITAWADTAERTADSETMRSLSVTVDQCLSDRTGLPPATTADDGGSVRPTESFLGLLDEVDSDSVRQIELTDSYVECTEAYFDQLALLLRAERPPVMAEHEEMLATLTAFLLDSGYTPYGM